MSDKKTTFEDKCSILTDLWLSYRTDPQFSDFVAYNDIGLPLSFITSEKLAKPSEMGKQLVSETFDLLLGALEIPEDTGFEDLEEILIEAGQ
jgi:hypothetical protein